MQCDLSLLWCELRINPGKSTSETPPMGKPVVTGQHPETPIQGMFLARNQKCDFSIPAYFFAVPNG